MKYISGCVDEATAYLVEDYPWGFRLKTSKRFWVETVKGKGQRVVSRTLNPKTGFWCAPKKSVYSAVTVIFLDENGHVKCDGLGMYGSSPDRVDSFVSKYGDYLDDYQLGEIEKIKKANERVYKAEIKRVVSAPVNIFSM